MESVLYDILGMVISALVATLLGYVTMRVNSYINAKLSKEQLEIATSFTRQMVLAAEQSGLSGYLAKDGQAKKEWAVNRVQEEMNRRGIKLDARIIADLIESAVFEYINSQKNVG